MTVPLLLYTDDTSGNRSKKWNKFDCWCFLLVGLPRHQNSQLHNIHFIACSNKVDCMEMSGAIVSDLKKLEDGIVMYDSTLKQNVLVFAPVIATLADNPRHSELRKWCKPLLSYVYGKYTICTRTNTGTMQCMVILTILS